MTDREKLREDVARRYGEEVVAEAILSLLSPDAEKEEG